MTTTDDGGDGGGDHGDDGLPLAPLLPAPQPSPPAVGLGSGVPALGGACRILSLVDELGKRR